MGRSRSQPLSFGYGYYWAQHSRRSRWFWLVAIGLNMVVTTTALWAWAAMVVRPLPVIRLAPDDAAVCPSMTGSMMAVAGPGDERLRAQQRTDPDPNRDRVWARVQVEAWIREMVHAALVMDSRLVKDHVTRLTTMLSPALRADFRKSAALRRRFVETTKAKARGDLQAFVVKCGESPQPYFRARSAPWYCHALGAIEYRPVLGELPPSVEPFRTYFFLELAIQPGEMSIDNPLGLEAIVFIPREATSQEALERMVAEEGL